MQPILFEQGRQLLDYPTPTDIFLIKPWLPIGSIVVLAGKPSLGKTPLAWAMADAVQTGGLFLGSPAQQGNALVLEFDMPMSLVKERWLTAKPPFRPTFGLLFDHGGVDSNQLTASWADKRHTFLREMLSEYQYRFAPKLVVIDALREVVRGNINEPGIADKLYDNWKVMFPDATILFVHHVTKDSQEKDAGDPMDKIKGSSEFVDVAQVGLMLSKSTKGTYLAIVKTQASEKPPPRFINITSDGVHFMGGH